MSRITTHILDTARGCPAAGVAVTLYRQADAGWELVGSTTTNSDGRGPDLLAGRGPLVAGVYRLHFATGAYAVARGDRPFYPWVDVVFELPAGEDHYHVPLLLSPFGYSTYRGS